MRERQRLGEILIAARLIDESRLRAGLVAQQRWGGRLGAALVRLGFLSEENLVRALATQLGTPVVHLRNKGIDPGVLELIPAGLAEKHGCIPLFTKYEGGVETLYVAMEDPNNLRALDELTFRTGLKLSPVLVSVTDLREALQIHYGGEELGEDDLTREFRETLLDPADTAPLVPRPDVGPGPPVEEPSPRARSAPAQVASEPGGKPREVRTRTILRAITQLLIEKDLIGRRELVDRIHSLGEPDVGD